MSPQENVDNNSKKFTKYSKQGWLLNIQPSSIKDNGNDRSALECFFIQEDAESFKTWIPFNPYFYVFVKDDHQIEVETYLKRMYEGKIVTIDIMDKEDLDLDNHLSGLKNKYLKVSFLNVQSLVSVRNELFPIIKRNKIKSNTSQAYEDSFHSFQTLLANNNLNNNSLNSGSSNSNGNKNTNTLKSATEYIFDIREYDVPYYVRSAIDLNIRVGVWYDIIRESGVQFPTVTLNKERVGRPDPRVLAFDIETTKAQLKFPNKEIDSIMMISYMLDKQGYLIVNREIVSQDIDDFEYTPKPEFPGPFTVFNEADEKATIERFFEHIKETKPHIFVTYNGDFFDWPFIEARAKYHDLDMYRAIGFRCEQEEYRSKNAPHMDAFNWVKRDSYLPHGSHGLKAVTREKLQYDPLELDPEKMVAFAQEQPETLANYSVSDAVATYYLYMTYVHPFIFSLCNIIPMNPDDVLRKGSGTLCEALLMCEAFKANVIYPNKHSEDLNKMYNGHLLESETYVGGHVECLESGVFRSDIPTDFTLDPEAIQSHIDNIDDVLAFAIKEGNLDATLVLNYQEVKDDVIKKFTKLKEQPKQLSPPLIYHLDVGAMYPNIILTNKLQPPAIVNEQVCATCVYNKPESQCQRQLSWQWRGDHSPSNASEYKLILQQLESERFGKDRKLYAELDQEERNLLLRNRLKEYSKVVYKKNHIISEEIRSDTVCMRENSFYIDTVKEFRDRRYIYKGLHRDWKIKYDQALKQSGGASSVAVQECQGMVVLYESLQLAHKCILNSFYGYVKRKGARWYSMEMAGIVTHTGSNIIKEARQVVEQLGRPLEIDTDGIWCILPSNFPENYTLKTSNDKKFTFSFLCEMLNEKVAKSFTNHQYQDFDPETNTYTIRDECSILFECDGPYRCMVIPTSKEKDVKLKKRYAVFNKQGRISELKGFEIKRRGELKLIKQFQSQVFEHFLGGDSLETCYQSVASVANSWLDIIDSHAEGYEDSELIDLITESGKMSRQIEDYGATKRSAISTAKKLAEFLGPEMIKDKGLTCDFIIFCKPSGAPVTERAIPVAILNTDADTKRSFLMKWTKTSSTRDLELRNLIDWDYYRQRLSAVIQKIITIPAADQSIANPVPRVPHPDWVLKRIREKDGLQQVSIKNFFTASTNTNPDGTIRDLEDMFDSRFKDLPQGPKVTKFKRVNQDSTSQYKRSRSTPEQNNARANKEKPPSFDKDFDDWLDFQKKAWRNKRRAKGAQKNRLNVFSTADTNAQDTDIDDEDIDKPSTSSMLKKRSTSSLSNPFFKSQSDLIKKGTWNIISIEPTNDPGIYQFWSLIDDQIVSIKVQIDRTFYLNSFQPDPYKGAEKVNAIPPRSKPRIHLYKVTVPEKEYIEESKEFTTLFTNPLIEGAYETKIPLNFTAILKVGCMASLKRNAPVGNKVVNQNTCFNLADIAMVHDRQYSYLAHQNFEQVYIYHNSKDGKDGLFTIVNISTNIATVMFVNPYTSNTNYNKLLNPLKEKFPDIQFQQVKHASSMKAAHKELTLLMEEFKSSATIVLLQSPNSTQLCNQVPSLKTFAKVVIPFHEQDSQYSPFNWELHAIKPLFVRLVDLPQLWIYYVNMARYGNIPIGNIPNDSASYISDVLYSRYLKENNHILWLSDSNFPDLGGSEEDDAKFYEELGSIQINQPDCYNNVCVELEISNLATNTILESNHLAEVEGILGTEFKNEVNFSILQEANSSFKDGAHNSSNNSNNSNKNSSGNGDQQQISSSMAVKLKSAISHQMSSSEREFNVIRNLVSKWKLDLVSGGKSKKTSILQRYSEYLLLHFYRWISSPYSGLYDPIIHKTLHNLMKKVFLQLLFEFKKYGATIVSANFNKIVLATQKSSVADAQSYLQFITSVIKKKDLFTWIIIKPINYWYNLLWMDSFNYSGLLYDNNNNNNNNNNNSNSNSLSSQLPDRDNSNNNTNVDQLLIDSHWNISEFLPTPIQNYFLIVISDYIQKVYQYKLDHQPNSSNSNSVIINNNNIKIEDKPLNLRLSSTWNEEEEKEKEKETLYKSKWDTIVDCNRIFGMLSSIQQSAGTLEFPQLPGSHLEMVNPALEFVKFICKALSVDRSIAANVTRIRKILLNMIKIREFSKEADFKDPCISYILPDVICSFCHSCRDLDLLRLNTKKQILDEDNNTNNDSDENQDSNFEQKLLQCTQCKNHYCKNSIESTLVEIITRRSLSYQLQDLKCSKCNNIKSDNLSEICSLCSGSWLCVDSKEKFSHDLNIFRCVAKYYNFDWLLETVHLLSNSK
ncbi:hypothetical protein CYY_001210 [Polysphondylium violaceum]|uniref:DNA polymerase epsilon catalytic subunit n=1 Tax=Polysphondylium violaceum TaxID=133409 RepID=A0A8J4Q0I1_9MYCE|nr:hypothetical protein CYY_001210 [Polysphondylium violaceum]